jgi:hypothetical protein
VIIFGGERGPRVAGGGPGCMALLLLSLVVSIVLILNVLIRLL